MIHPSYPSLDKPVRNARKVDLSGPHDDEFRIAVPILVMNVVDEACILLHPGERVHPPVGDVPDIGRPPGDGRIQAFQNNPVILFRTVNGSMRRIRMERGYNPRIGCTARHRVDDGYEVLPAGFELVATCGDLDGAQQRPGEALQQTNRFVRPAGAPPRFLRGRSIRAREPRRQDRCPPCAVRPQAATGSDRSPIQECTGSMPVKPASADTRII